MNKKKKEDSAEKKQKETKLKQSKRKVKKKKASSRGSLDEVERAGKRQPARPAGQQASRPSALAGPTPQQAQHAPARPFLPTMHWINPFFLSPKKRVFLFLLGQQQQPREQAETPFFSLAYLFL